MSSGQAELKPPPASGGVKRVLVGRPMASGEMEETLLPKWMALPIFASDPISSVAYATEAAMVVLVGVSVAALKHVLPVSIGIAALLAIVGFSYTQTVRAYESSGGAYVVRCAAGSCPHAVAPHALPAGAGALGLFVILKAFASGSAALTGVEAIANGVNAFRRPQSRNAAQTLLILLGISISLFLGVSYLAIEMHARPSATTSVISEIGKAAFGGGVPYYLLQGFTFA